MLGRKQSFFLNYKYGKRRVYLPFLKK